MNYSIVVSDSAAKNIAEAVSWYEGLRYGLGENLVEEISACYSRIAQSPTAFKYYRDFIRIVRLRKYPYLVLYEIFGDVIYIHDVLHASQDLRKKL